MNNTENATLHTEWAAPLCADLDAAVRSIIITALSLHPPRHSLTSPIALLWTALAAAAARGVAIDFILPTPSRAHPATAMNLSASQRLHAIGARAHFAPLARLLHAKTAIIDARTVWIGSGNWTAAATAYNHEAYLRLTCPAVAAKLLTHWTDLHFLEA